MATVTSDAGTCPDLVLVVGTKLRVPGARSIATQICRAARRAGGTGFWISREVPGSSIKGLYDHVVIGDCDDVNSPGIFVFMDRGHEKRF
jgi:NAD-dependent SIR2 family protein deacetylase